MNHLNSVDSLVIGFYFCITLGVAWWAARSSKKDAADYFLAGRDNGWFVIGASMFASNIGSEHLVGLAGSGASSGLAVGHFEWLSSIMVLILGWLFVPFYLRSSVVTMPEFLERRYNRGCRWYLTLLSVVSYILTKVSVGLYAGGVVIESLTGLDTWYSAGVIVIVTGLYTVAGGLRAVLYTDALQSIIFVIGTTVLVLCGLNEVGGWEALRESVPAGHFSMWKTVSDPNFPWTGIVFGAPILGMWYWCTDQYMVQRELSAKSLDQAQTAAVFTGYLKILPVFLFVLPGVIAASLYPQLNASNSDRALPMLLLNLALPIGVRGLIIAALLAALMSSLSSTFNSCSTLVTWDLYRQLHPTASERTLVNVGRISTVVMVILGLAWIPFMKYISSQLYIYLQSVSGYLAPPIAACFLLGLFIPRLNGIGALTTMIVGFCIGMLRLVMELGAKRGTIAEGSFWRTFAEINFLHFAALLFVFCSALLIVVSYCTKAPDPDRIAGLTWRTANQLPQSAAMTEHSRGLRTLNITLSVLLVAIVCALWTIFA
ncbi:MAG: sodium:solute symporter [Planctomycetaceae bacterium]